MRKMRVCIISLYNSSIKLSKNTIMKEIKLSDKQKQYLTQIKFVYKS